MLWKRRCARAAAAPRIATGRGGDGPRRRCWVAPSGEQIKVERAERRALDSLVPEGHQGVVAELLEATLTLGDESALEARLRALTNPFLLILEGVLDPRNLGRLVCVVRRRRGCMAWSCRAPAWRP